MRLCGFPTYLWMNIQIRKSVLSIIQMQPLLVAKMSGIPRKAFDRTYSILYSTWKYYFIDVVIS